MKWFFDSGSSRGAAVEKKDFLAFVLVRKIESSIIDLIRRKETAVKTPAGSREFQVLAKPVGARCNLRCGYCCYLPLQIPQEK